MNTRPNNLSEFIGQTNLKQKLQISIDASKTRDDALDHILFSGPPGLGKTSLAYAIANEKGVNIKVIAAPAINKISDLAGILTNIKINDVLFLDEIHRLQKNIEEMLYSAIEDFRLDILIGEGPSAKILNIKIPKFTLIGATTRIGMISKPLRDRFGMIFNLNFYSIEEQSELVRKKFEELKIEYDDESIKAVAMRSRGTPRIALKLIRRVKDFLDYKGINILNKSMAKEIFSILAIDEYGLEDEDRRYIKFLLQTQKPVGINTICSALSFSVDTIEDYIEPYLLIMGIIQKTPRGRILTDFGKSLKDF